MAETKNAHRIIVRNLLENILLQDREGDGRAALRQIIRREDVRV
jgi:hypothetical protein